MDLQQYLHDQGARESIDYVEYHLAYNWGPYTLTSDSSFEVYPGDVVSFRMRAQYHGNNGHTSEYVRIYADGQLLKQIGGNATGRSLLGVADGVLTGTR